MIKIVKGIYLYNGISWFVLGEKMSKVKCTYRRVHTRWMRKKGEMYMSCRPYNSFILFMRKSFGIFIPPFIHVIYFHTYISFFIFFFFISTTSFIYVSFFIFLFYTIFMAWDFFFYIKIYNRTWEWDLNLQSRINQPNFYCWPNPSYSRLVLLYV